MGPCGRNSAQIAPIDSGQERKVLVEPASISLHFSGREDVLAENKTGQTKTKEERLTDKERLTDDKTPKPREMCVMNVG